MAHRLLVPTSSRATGRWPRVAGIVLLALQALVWGGGSIIEAQAAAESLTRSAHVEDNGNPECPPIHSHLDCLVCRTLTGGAIGGHAPSLEPVWLAIAAPDLGAPSFGTGAARGPLGSRAPPCA